MDTDTKLYEHVSISDPIFDKLDTAIRSSYPNCCIIQIQRVLVNPVLEEKFLKHYEYCQTKTQTKIEQLYHGTGRTSIKSIITDGFLVSKNVASAYGRGTYFSNVSTMAQSYATSKLSDLSSTISYMIVADVIISDMALGSLSSSSSSRPSCYVNDIKNPSIFCIPFDYAAVARYIISFHKEAGFNHMTQSQRQRPKLKFKPTI